MIPRRQFMKVSIGTVAAIERLEHLLALTLLRQVRG